MNNNNINNDDNNDDDSSEDSSSSSSSTISRVVDDFDDDFIGDQIQAALANESNTKLVINLLNENIVVAFPPTDAQRIMDCLRVRNHPRFTLLRLIYCHGLDNPTVLNIICNGLLDCPYVTSVEFPFSNLTSEGLDLLQPALYNTSITTLDITGSSVLGQRGGEALRNLMVGNNSLVDLNLRVTFDRQFVIALGNCFHHLQKLVLAHCDIGYDLTSFLLPTDGMHNTALLYLDLTCNGISGAEGGRQVGLVLQHCPNLKVLKLLHNNLGPLGARAMAPSLAAACNLESLDLDSCGLGVDGVMDLVLDGQVKTSLTSLDLSQNDINGLVGGRKIGLVLQHYPNLKELQLCRNHIGSRGSHAMAPVLVAAMHLETLDLYRCHIGNDGVGSLTAEGQVNMSLTSLNLKANNIQGAEGGQQVGLLLQRCPNLKVLNLRENYDFGPLGARAMTPGLAAASNLESLNLCCCGIGNDAVMGLVLDGQVNMSLTSLNLEYNNIQGANGGENVVGLAARCMNLDRLDVEENILNPDQRRRLDLLLDPKHRLCIEAQALAGSTFPILFRFMEERAHGHEHGLSAIFVILQNDGDDYFCTANNRAIP